MRFLITITTSAGTLNVWADTENDARLCCQMLADSEAVVRLQIHATDKAGLITGLRYEAEVR